MYNILSFYSTIQSILYTFDRSDFLKHNSDHTPRWLEISVGYQELTKQCPKSRASPSLASARLTGLSPAALTQFMLQLNGALGCPLRLSYFHDVTYAFTSTENVLPYTPYVYTWRVQMVFFCGVFCFMPIKKIFPSIDSHCHLSESLLTLLPFHFFLGVVCKYCRPFPC